MTHSVAALIVISFLRLFTPYEVHLNIAADTSLVRSWQQTDQIYQQNPAEGFRRFGLLYRRAIQLHDQVIELKCLNLFTEYYWTTHNYHAALAQGLKTMAKAKRYGNDSLAGDACVLTGLVYYSDGKYQQAINYYQQAVNCYKGQPSGKRIALAYMNLGVANRKASRFEAANSSYFLAADIFRRLKDSSDLASTYTAIGNCYSSIENYAQAAIYHHRSLSIFRLIHDKDGTAESLNNLGYTQKQLGQPDSAIICLNQSVRMLTAEKDSSVLILPLQNLGICWKLKKDPQKAIRFILRSLKIAQFYHMAEELARGQTDLADILLDQGQFTAANQALITAEKIAGNLRLADLKMDIAELNYRLQAQQGHDHLALLYYQKRDSIRDSLVTVKKNRAIEAMEALYQARERQRDITGLHSRERLAQKMLKQQQLSIVALITAALLLLLLMILAYYSFRRQRIATKTVSTLMHEVQHRTKNNLQLLNGLLLLQINSQDNEAAKSALQEMETRLNAMNIMHGKLYSEAGGISVDLKEYLDSLLAHIHHSFLQSHHKIELITDVETLVLNADKAVSIGLIINELIANSIKFSLAKNGGTLTVKLRRKTDRMAELLVSDNGEPFKKKTSPGSSSFGLKIVALLIKQIDATLTTDPENPYAYQILFKI
jgi:two-component sensor histidine kinase